MILIVSFSLNAQKQSESETTQNEKLQKPEPIGNEIMDSFVESSFMIYDSSYALKNAYLPSLDAKVADLIENYSEIEDPITEKENVLKSVVQVNEAILGMTTNATELLGGAPNIISESISTVPIGLSAGKMIKGIKNNGKIGTMALKESLGMLPNMAKMSKELIEKTNQLTFTTKKKEGDEKESDVEVDQ